MLQLESSYSTVFGTVSTKSYQKLFLKGTFSPPNSFYCILSLLRAVLIIICAEHAHGTCCSWLKFKCKWTCTLIIHSSEINLYLSQNQRAEGEITVRLQLTVCSLVVTLSVLFCASSDRIVLFLFPFFIYFFLKVCQVCTPTSHESNITD